jgi:formate hydrogenlyase subunit 3/multisubunit Na+/H+ antiporter MnhD subunit
MPLAAALWSVAALLSIALLAILVCRSRAGGPTIYAACLAVSLIILGIAVAQLIAGGAAVTLRLPIGLPWVGANFRLDALAALFLAVVDLGAAGASLFALGYGRHEQSPARVLPFYPAFLGGMNLVILADDAFTFLVSWEFMSLSSWALVMAHHENTENRRAGYVYIMMAGFGTLALLLAFGLLAGPHGNYAFAGMADVVRAEWAPGLILLLVLLGAGSKAGVVPLHVWLPLAHPAAPSHVSALMSGVMTKVAIYGFVRIVFDLMGSPAWWWSIVVLAVGGISAVLGVLSALMQRDLKRLLAYSTIENVGIIFIGLGLALAFKANGMTAAAALAFTAALLHVINHSLFKSLLFFAAGAVLTATGERDIEKLGGLIQRMPQVAFLALGGCIAISALPPLNGFVSEWLIFQAILLSPDLPQWGLKLMVPAVGAMLALSAALSAACFVRAYGITFLGRARSPAAVSASETDGFSRAAMGVLLALCLLFGLLPGIVIDVLAPITQRLAGQAMPPQTGIAWMSIVPIAQSRSSYNGLLVFVFITISTLVVIEIIHRFASRAVRRGPAWDCGFPDPSPATQYTADSFAQPIRRVFGPVVFQLREHVDMPPPGDARPARLTVTLRDLAWDAIYVPTGNAVRVTADKLNTLQFLTIRQYLSLVFVALVALLLGISIWT